MIDPSPRRKKVTQKNFPIPSGLNITYHTADGTAIRPPRVMNVIEALCAAECLFVIAIRSLLVGICCQGGGRSRPDGASALTQDHNPGSASIGKGRRGMPGSLTDLTMQRRCQSARNRRRIEATGPTGRRVEFSTGETSC